MLSRLIVSALPLLVVFLAFYLILRPILNRAGFRLSDVLASGAAAAVGTVWRLGLVVIATIIDAIITTLLALYHAATVARGSQVADDWAGFLQRLNDRVLRVVTR
jgi:hypothetical protein